MRQQIRIWNKMKAKLNQKYLSNYFLGSTAKQIEQAYPGNSLCCWIHREVWWVFDPVQFVDESPMVTLSRFRSDIRDDLCRELLARCLWPRTCLSNCSGLRCVL